MLISTDMAIHLKNQAKKKSNQNQNTGGTSTVVPAGMSYTLVAGTCIISNPNPTNDNQPPFK
jgi:hypothetical protein